MTLHTRDQLLIGFALTGVVALAWAYLYAVSLDMDLGGMASMHAWTLLDVALMFVMWAVMMVGMMVPSAVRAVLIYDGIARRADAQGTPVAAASWFVAGYVLVWTLFSIVAAALQWALVECGLLSQMAVSVSPVFGAGLLIAAGVYQLTSWKDRCLKHCQSPAMYLAQRFKPGVANAVGLGIGHGAYCLGCCWLLMGLLFFGGVMNLVWIAAVAAFILLEKMLPATLRLARVTGVIMIVSGTLYLGIF